MLPWLKNWTEELRQREIEDAFETMFKAAIGGDFEALDIILACAASDGHEKAQRLRAAFGKRQETVPELDQRIEDWLAKQVNP